MSLCLQVLLVLFLWMTLTNCTAQEGRKGVITCFLKVPNVPRGKLCCLLALDTACPEDQPTLVADHEAVLAALTLGLGRPSQQAAMAAPLQTQEETPVGEARHRTQWIPMDLSAPPC